MRLRNALAMLLAVACFAASPAAVYAQSAPVLGSNTTLSVTSGGNTIALPADTNAYPSVALLNDGANELFYGLGVSSPVTVTTSAFPLPPGACVSFNAKTSAFTTAFIGAMTASGSTTLRVIQSTQILPLGCGGGGGSGAGAATAANQTNGSQQTQIVDSSGNVIASTSHALNVQCANCSGSGVSATDETTFTPGTSVFAPGGGLYQTTPTSNPLTSGQQGAFQVTANRALFANLRNAAGTEEGTSANPLQVSLANTGANSTPVQVSQQASQATTGTLQSAATASGNGTTLSVSGLSSAVLTVNCSGCSGGTTVNFEGTQDGTNYSSVSAVQLGTATIGTATTTAGLTYWQLPVAGLSTVRARISGYSVGTVTVTGTAVPVSWGPKEVYSNLFVNGSAVATGSGAAGSTTPRVDVAQDTTTIAGSAPGTAGSPSANVLSVQGVASGTAVPVSLSGNQPVNVAQVGGNNVPSVGSGVTGVAVAPTSASGAAITPVVSTAAESSHVLKGSAGNLYSLQVTTGATAGYLLVFNATSAPADGSVTPIHCQQAPANTTVSYSPGGGAPPDAYSTGITAVFSTTGCFTKTASATAMFEGRVQ